MPTLGRLARGGRLLLGLATAACAGFGCGESGSSSYTLTVDVSPAGSGTVTLDPPGGSYARGTVVTLTATASADYALAGWLGDLSGNANPVSVTMNASKTITASFTSGAGSGPYTLTTAAAPTAGGVVSLDPPGGTYARGTVVTIRAFESAAYVFSDWGVPSPGTGDLVASTNPVRVTMDMDRSATANFVACTQRHTHYWPRFRGPGGLGVSVYDNAPTSWDGQTSQGIKWKKAVPLRGVNSPVVIDGKVFLSGANTTTREVYCFDADTGAILWRKTVNAPGGSPPMPEGIYDSWVFAGPTVATDGERVCAMFANGDVGCFTVGGSQLWVRNLGVPQNMYGHCSSLDIWGGLLIVQLDQSQNSRLLALDVLSGETVWQASREDRSDAAHTSPIRLTTASGAQLVAHGCTWLHAYNPITGGALWRANFGPSYAVSPAFGAGYVVARDGEGGRIAAYGTDGSGDVTSSHLKWTQSEMITPNVTSLVSANGLVFSVSEYGRLTCLSASDGTKQWEQNLSLGFCASPVVSGDRLYLLSSVMSDEDDDNGTMVIVRTSATYEEIGRPVLGEKCRGATPALADGRIYVRARDNLYCIGQ